MKKSLVAVLLSLVALTVVAGAAFAGGSFDVTFTVTLDGTAKEVTVDLSKLSPVTSKDFTIGQKLSGDVASVSDTLEAEKTVEFAVKSGDVKLDNTYTLDADGKLAAAEKTITANTTYILAVASNDKYYAVKAAVTFKTQDGGDPVNPPSKTVLDAIKAYFKNATILDSTSAGVTIKSITTSQESKAKSEAATGNKKAVYATKLIVISPDISGDDLYFAFQAKLSDATEGHLLGLVKVPESKLGTSSLVEIAEDDTVVFFSEAGKVIETVPADKTVNPAVKVKAGDSFVAVITTEERKGGGSPSGGCDMGLLGSLALFAVALLPLRKSR